MYSFRSRFESPPCFSIDHIVELVRHESYFVALRHQSTGRMYLFIICRRTNTVYYRLGQAARWDAISEKEDYQTIIDIIHCCLEGQDQVMVIRR